MRFSASSRGLRGLVAIGGLSVAAALALAARAMRPEPALPVYGRVPDFHLVDEQGASFDTRALSGHVSVVDFIFTHCTSTCPRLTATMAGLQTRIASEGRDARLVSFSVDPENDTPRVLAEYARQAHADPARWTFVTGPANDVALAITSGFKVSAAKVARGAADYDVVHGNWFVLVDRQGQIRGYFDTTDPAELEALDHAIARL